MTLQQLKDEYLQQLRNGCGQTFCYRIFCRSKIGEGLVDALSDTLSGYGDAFMCKNVRKTIERRLPYENSGKEGGNAFLNFFFCLNARIFNPAMCSPSDKENIEITAFPHIRRSKDGLEGSSMITTRDLKRMRKRDTSIEGYEMESQIGSFCHGVISECDSTSEVLDHEMCLLMQKDDISSEEKQILTGMFQLLLKKYENLPHFSLGIIIVRIYGLVGRYIRLDAPYYSILYKTFCNIHSLRREMFEVSLSSKRASCEVKGKCGEKALVCIYSPKLTKLDLKIFVESTSRLLNASKTVDNRENRKIDHLLNIFHLLYLMNIEYKALSYKKFYLTGFCAKINFRDEFKYFRTKSKTPLNFPFILPVHIKAELVKYENGDKMKISLQDSFFRSLFEGHVNPYLLITVSRETVYTDTIEVLNKLEARDARKQLKITFKGEEGVDSGGIRKEYFQLLSQKIREDSNLFEHVENRIWIKPSGGSEDCYEAIGKIIALALYNNVVLDVPFPSLFFKKLLEKKSCFKDIRDISSGMAASLLNLEKLSREEIDSLEMNFVVEYHVDGEVKTWPLVENGENIKLTVENLKMFIERYSDFHTDTLVKNQLEAIKRGFYSIVDRDIVLCLDPKELEKIVMGSNTFDIEAIRSTTTYSGFSGDTQVIVHFWEIFREFNQRKKKQLLQFITGNDRIPVFGPTSLRLIIMKNGCDTERLPSSQTCFNTLLLPEYSSKEKLERKLKTALELTAGFFLL